MEEKEKKTSIIRIGKELKDVFEMQRKKIAEATWGCVHATDREVGEILAKKIKENKLIEV